MPSLLVLAAITYLSLIKEVPFQVMGDIPLADKWGHMAAYLVLALCIAGDGYRARLGMKAVYLSAVLVPLTYGGLMEVVQLQFPPRRGEWTDWLADAIGTAAGVALFILFRLWNRRLKQKDADR